MVFQTVGIVAVGLDWSDLVSAPSSMWEYVSVTSYNASIRGIISGERSGEVLAAFHLSAVGKLDRTAI